jgi:hypothetical protein
MELAHNVHSKRCPLHVRMLTGLWCSRADDHGSVDEHHSSLLSLESDSVDLGIYLARYPRPAIAKLH